MRKEREKTLGKTNRGIWWAKKGKQGNNKRFSKLFILGLGRLSRSGGGGQRSQRSRPKNSRRLEFWTAPLIMVDSSLFIKIGQLQRLNKVTYFKSMWEALLEGREENREKRKKKRHKGKQMEIYGPLAMGEKGKMPDWPN